MWIEGKVKRLEASVDRLSSDKREMQREIERLKEQYVVVCKEAGDL